MILGEFTYFLNILTKGAFILGSVIYLIFAGIIVKQVNTMTKNVKDKFNLLLISFAYIHFFFTVFIIFLILTLL